MDVLAEYYPKWINNCLESARWLRSPECETFYKDLELEPLTIEEREAKALEYEAKADFYRGKLNRTS